MISSLYAFLLVLASIFHTSESLSSPKLLQKALALSRQAAANITAAQQACRLWDRIHVVDDEHVQLLCLRLQASCLVRIGDDRQAIRVYNQALSISNNTTDLWLGKAQCLQRLMHYESALDCYLEGGDMPRAVTCAMRLGSLKRAMKLVQEQPNAEVMGIFQYMSSKDGNVKAISNPATLVGSWLAYCLYGDPMPQFPLMDYCECNIGAFDDPFLSHLDDKIHLHHLIQSRDFWPTSWIVSNGTELQDEHRDGKENMYFIKQRAGYGSHGNEVVRGATNAMLQATRWQQDVLVQEMVDNPFLLQQRKFSLRVYVVSVGDKKHKGLFRRFLHRDCLVKLASAEYQENSSESSMHMTNSGREMDADQWMWSDLEEEAWKQGFTKQSVHGLWHDIRDAVSSCIEDYSRFVNASQHTEMLEARAGVASLGLPKILGFDFVVSVQGNRFRPWLVEVNRFPGLEPRDSKDAAVKQGVIQDAWKTAQSVFSSTSSELPPAMRELECSD